MDALREGLQDCHAIACQAKQRGDTRAWEVEKARAERLMLDYIGNGYVTRLWNELVGMRP